MGQAPIMLSSSFTVLSGPPKRWGCSLYILGLNSIGSQYL